MIIVYQRINIILLIFNKMNEFNDNPKLLTNVKDKSLYNKSSPCNILNDKIKVRTKNDVLNYKESKIDSYLEKITSRIKEAISYKKTANKLFKGKNYEESLKYYKKVI